MQAVIFAAGKGSRFNEVTKSKPKPLIEVKGNPIISRVINNLPDEISEVIIVIGHLGDKIREYLGNEFNSLPIKYVEQGNFLGTAGALSAAKDYLNGDRFLILNGDDLISKKDFPEFKGDNWFFGVSPVDFLPDKFFNVILDESGFVRGLERAKSSEKSSFHIATGVCVIDKRIFNFKPEKVSNGEISALFTIIEASKEIDVKSFKMKNWFPINNENQLKIAEESI